MTVIPGELSDTELFTDSRQRFDSRPDIGPMTGIGERLARYLGGDPIAYTTATSPNSSTISQLPNESRARVAVITVITGPCFYRTDGSNPATTTEQVLQIGDVVTLSGQPTIQGFKFAASGNTACNLAINYYD
jgi:hypothetical protein